jgi:DDE superfamily endonuclease
LEGGKTLRYLTEDESRFGLKTETGKVITNAGVKPKVPVSWKRDNFWIYGVVEPLSGWQFTQEHAKLDTEHFQQFIDALSVQLGEDVAIIQLDQAGAHVTPALRWADNLIPICQPAHSPELNPIERVWQHLKAQLKGVRFETIEQLRQRIQQVIQQTTPERIMSLSGYDFILEALFYAASH